MRGLSSWLMAVISLAGILAGCSLVARDSDLTEVTGDVPTTVPTPTTEDISTDIPASTDVPGPTPEPVMMPAFTVGEMEVLVTKADRDARGLTFWPDGNIGVVGVDGAFAFFAPDARTTGPLDAPAQGVNVVNIQGVNPEYTYAAGGPIYRDPTSGVLLMYYHAEIAPADGWDYSWHYSLIGLAISEDQGFTFRDLGEIIRPESEQGTQHDTIRDVAGGTYVIHDGYFYVYSRDFPTAGGANHLTVARAPVEQVVQAALAGETIEWRKYYDGEFSEPGLGGRSTPLELGNPEIGWMGAAYNTFLDAYIMVVSHHNVPGSPLSENLYLITSPDGIHWSPRVAITSGVAENAYPTIIGLDGDSSVSGETFYIYNAYSDIGGVRRWDDARLVRHPITLTGMVEAPRRWDFDVDGSAEGWTIGNQLTPLEVNDSTLRAVATGDDPFVFSPPLAIPADYYPLLDIRMKVSAGHTGWVFFMTDANPRLGDNETKLVSFPLIADGEYHTYSVDMSQAPEWLDTIIGIRIDPTEVEGGEIAIDSIEFVSPWLPSRWDFNTDGDAEGWMPQNQLEPFAVTGGSLITQSLGNDPYMASPRLAIRADAYPIMEIRMKVSDGFVGQVFFTTDSDPFEGEEKSLRFNVTGDGEFHTYTLDMSQVEEWQGVITSVRIDPIQTAGAAIEIDYVEFLSP